MNFKILSALFILFFSLSALAQITPIANQNPEQTQAQAMATIAAQISQMQKQELAISTKLDDFTTKADLNAQLAGNFATFVEQTNNDLLYYFGLFVLAILALNGLVYYWIIKRLKKINTGI